MAYKYGPAIAALLFAFSPSTAFSMGSSNRGFVPALNPHLKVGCRINFEGNEAIHTDGMIRITTQAGHELSPSLEQLGWETEIRNRVVYVRASGTRWFPLGRIELPPGLCQAWGWARVPVNLTHGVQLIHGIKTKSCKWEPFAENGTGSPGWYFRYIAVGLRIIWGERQLHSNSGRVDHAWRDEALCNSYVP